MAIAFACPGCATPFNVTEQMAGKRARCPKCSMVFTLPGGTTKAAIEAPPARVPALPGDLFPKMDPDEDRPRRRSKRPSRDADDFQERDEREERDEPRPRRKKKAKANTGLMWGLIIGGAGLFLLLVCGGIITVIVVVAMDQPAPVGRPVAVVNQQGQRPAVAPTRIALVNGVFTTNGQLTANDPIDHKDGGFRCKLFQVDLQPGRTYIIDMQSNALDSYLRLEDSKGLQIMEDDDSGGALNARLIFTPARADSYVIVATTFNENTFGPFTLSIRENNPGGMFKK